LTGGRGEDVFGFSANDGADIITDFEIGSDQISISGIDPDDLFLSQADSAVVIEAEGLRIELENTDLEELEDAGFLI
jgi:Ca2+-binding RTX toxin-like protein